MFHAVELVLALLAATVLLAMLARKLGVSEPILFVVGGLVLGLQPWTPGVTLDPQLVFLFFLPPLLYAAAFRTPWPAFRANLRAITLLAVGLVLFSAAAVAAAAHYLLDLPWAAAAVLGAIVSPPDAVAAVAVTRRLRVPDTVTTVLEGESLVNDATALVALRFAVGAVVTGGFDPGAAAAEFALAAGGGIGVGVTGGWLACRLHRVLDCAELSESKLVTSVTVLTPFAVYLAAERLHVSGVLAVVTAGLWVGNRAERVFRPELLAEGRAVWEWAEFLLTGLVFVLVGLALREVLDGFTASRTPGELLLGAAGVAGAAVIARLVWMFPGAYLPRWVDNRLGCPTPYPPWQAVAVVGWTGMRGAVSLAAALSLPRTTEAGQPFPGRDLIQLLTFAVIFATLVGQGLTLPGLIRWLGVSEGEEAAPPSLEAEEGAAGAADGTGRA